MDLPVASQLAARTGRTRRLGPALCGGALVVAGLVVAVNDPSAPGSRYPACSFRQLTGLWCPGCGLTRGTHQLLRGDLVGAVGHNIFTPAVLGAVVAIWWVWWRSTGDRPVRRPAMAVPGWIGFVAAVVVIGYGVVRNIPAAPFSSLAP